MLGKDNGIVVVRSLQTWPCQLGPIIISSIIESTIISMAYLFDE